MSSENVMIFCILFVLIPLHECKPFTRTGMNEEMYHKEDGISFAERNIPPDQPKPTTNIPTTRKIPTTTTQLIPISQPAPKCFPSTSKVNLADGKVVTMSELQVGDQIQAVSPNGTVIYSEVRAFLERQPRVISRYVLITTSLNSRISLSENHLIYARKKAIERFCPVYTCEISIGDELLILGAHAPLTMEGNIIVDGILASCYASSDHYLAHFGMTPIKWFPEAMNWIFGTDNEFPVYVNTAKHFRRWMLPHWLNNVEDK